MRIAFVTTEEPLPAHHGGRRRTLSQLALISAMPEVKRVELFAVSASHPVRVWRSPAHIPRLLRLRLFDGVPYVVAKWDSQQMHRRLEQATCDLAYLDHLGAAAYLRHFDGKRLVLDAHNIESDLIARFGERRRGVLNALSAREAALTRRYEEDVFRRVDAVVTISPKDAGGPKAVFVPMHVERRTRAAPNGAGIAFVGTASWHPNAAGLRWFRAEVWPIVKVTVPAATFEMNRPGSSDADIGALYDRSIVLVAPMFGGSGMSVKVLDGLAAGMPVVTTTDGARGFVSSEAMRVADDPRAFAEHVIRLLRDRACLPPLVRRRTRVRRRVPFARARSQGPTPCAVRCPPEYTA